MLYPQGENSNDEDVLEIFSSSTGLLMPNKTYLISDESYANIANAI